MGPCPLSLMACGNFQVFRFEAMTILQSDRRWEVKSDLASLFQFVREVADSLLDSWGPIVQRRRHMEFSQQQKEWQMLRRGR